MALNFEHGLYPRGVAQRIAYAPARHGVRLRERAADHHAGAQLGGQLPGGKGLRRRMSEVQIALVADDPDVMFGGDLDDLAELVGRDDSAAWVIRRIDDEQLRFWRNRVLHHLGGQHKVVRFRADKHRVSTQEAGNLRKRHPVGRGDQHIVAFVDNRCHRIENPLLAADGDDDLRRLVLGAKVALDHVEHGAFERRNA